MMNNELTKLIQTAIDGDSTAFERIVEMKAKQIIYISVKLMRNRQDGEDAAQEAMLKMYQNIDKLKSVDSFHSWMYQIISRTCIDMKRKLAREEHDYLDPEEELNEERREFLPQEYIEDVGKRDFLMGVIDQLPEKYRTCLLFYYYEELTYQEIAEATGTTAKIVDNSLQRAKRRIKRQLEEKYGEINPLSIFQGVAVLPVLGQAFQMDAAAHVTQEAVARLISSAGAGSLAAGSVLASSSAPTAAASTTVSASTGASAAGSASTAAAGTAGALSTSAKIVIGIVTAAAVTGGAAYTLYPGNPAALEERDSPTAQEEAAILTLEDMIGAENARVLEDYVNGDEDPELWQDFLQSLQPAILSGVEDGVSQYTLYHLEKQDKQLMILEKLEPELLEVAYRFTDVREEPPRRGDLLRSVEGWRQ